MPCARRSAATSAMSCNHEVRQQVSAVQIGAVPDQRRPQRIVPEPRDQRPDQQRLHHRHLGVRRHLEAAQLQQAQPAAGGVGAVQLVDAELGAVGVAGDVGQQVPQRPVDHPGRDGAVLRRSASRAISANAISSSYSVSARPSSARGACEVGADEPAGEQVRQRRMTLPVGQHRHQQVGPAQQRRIRRGDAAEGDVVAAAGAAVAAVDVERLGASRLCRASLVQRCRLTATCSAKLGRRLRR